MAFAFLTKDNFKKIWEDSEEYNRKLQDPFREYERISRNRPHPKIDKAYPKVTDGTLASIIQETPKRYIQQIPTGTVEVKGGPVWLPLFANYKLQKEFIPKANAQADVLVKSWNAGSKSMTYGSQDGFVFFDNYGEYYGPNFKLPFITDVYLEKGKLTDKESNVIFMRAWYQKSDIEAIIDKERKLARSAKKRGEEYESTWDLSVLEEIKTNETTKEDKQKTPIDKERSVDQSGVEIIHGFQRGVGQKFFSYATSVNKVCRTKVNKDPRGCIPIHRLYCNLDLSNPYGRGVVEQSGGKQNLVDSHMQAFQYMQALSMNPPLKIKGNVRRGTIKYVPNAVWDLTNDPNAEITTVDINTTALTNFSNTYGLLKSQILNENSSLDTSISSEVGNPGYSKTPAGINAQESKLGVSDNYLRKQYESWFQEICETMLNIFFSEMSGVKEEILDKQTADKFREIAPELFVSDDPEEDTIMIDYDILGQEPMYFEVDASTSATKDDGEAIENITNLLDITSKFGGLPQSKQMALLNKLINKFGIEDPEDVTFTKDEIAKVKDQEQMQSQMAEQQAEMGGMEGEMLPEGMPEGVDPMMAEQEMEQPMPEEMMEEPQDDPIAEQEQMDQEVIAGLQERGYSEPQINDALILLNDQEMPIEEVLATIGEPQMAMETA